MDWKLINWMIGTMLFVLGMGWLLWTWCQPIEISDGTYEQVPVIHLEGNGFIGVQRHKIIGGSF